MPQAALQFAVCLGLALIAAYHGASFAAGEWYTVLVQPTWAPSRWALALGWPACYLAVALHGWVVWRDGFEDGARGGMAILPWTALMLGGVAAWFWLLLGLHRTGWALAALTLLLGVLVLCAARFTAPGRPARLLILPALAWLAWIWAWNLSVWRLSGGGFNSLLGLA